MDQRAIARYLTMKSLSITDIHRDFETILDFKAITYSTVTYYLQMSSFRAPHKVVDDTDEEHQVTEIDQSILKIFANESFSSVCELARYT
jgi:hypothetical protein